MKKITSLFVAMLLLLSSCGSVPLTGRKQVLLVSDQEVLSSSLTQYSDYILAETTFLFYHIDSVIKKGSRYLYLLPFIRCIYCLLSYIWGGTYPAPLMLL